MLAIANTVHRIDLPRHRGRQGIVSMPYKVALLVEGLSFDDDATLDSIGAHLSDLMWMRRDGRLTATWTGETADPVLRTLRVADRIRDVFPNCCVRDLDDDLVGISDIAQRSSVSREAVRHWINGSRGPGRFPTPAGSIGSGARGATKLWRWAVVNAWLDNHYRLSDGFRYLDERQRAVALERLTRVGHEKTVARVDLFMPNLLDTVLETISADAVTVNWKRSMTVALQHADPLEPIVSGRVGGHRD